MSDRAFVSNAKQRWDATLELAEKKDAQAAATIIALWATMNVDRLLEVAGRGVRP